MSAASNTSFIDESHSSSSNVLINNFHGKHQYSADVLKEHCKRIKPSSNRVTLSKANFHIFGSSDALIVTFEKCNLKRKATVDERALLVSFYYKFSIAQEYQNVMQADNIIRFVVLNWRWTSWQCQSALSIGDSRYQRLKRELSAENYPFIESGDVIIDSLKLFVESFDENSGKDGTNKHAPVSISCHQHCCFQIFVDYSKHCVESLQEPQVLRDSFDKVVPFRPRVSEWKMKQDIYTDYNSFCKVYPMHFRPLSRSTFFRNIKANFDEVIKLNILSEATSRAN